MFPKDKNIEKNLIIELEKSLEQREADACST